MRAHAIVQITSVDTVKQCPVTWQCLHGCLCHNKDAVVKIWVRDLWGKRQEGCREGSANADSTPGNIHALIC